MIQEEIPFHADQVVADELLEYAEVDSIMWDQDEKALVIQSDMVGAPLLHFAYSVCDGFGFGFRITRSEFTDDGRRVIGVNVLD